MTQTGQNQPAVSDGMKNQPKRRQALGNRFDFRRDGLRLALALTVLLLVNTAVWWVVVRPLQAQIDMRQEDNLKAEQIERRSINRLEEVRAVHTHTLRVQEGIRGFFEDMLSIAALRMVKFQRAVHEVGKEFKVQPERVANNLTRLEAEGIEVFTYNFPLVGGYENLRSFLERLEKLDQFLIIREVALRSSSKEGGRDLQLDVAVETYFNDPNMRDKLERENIWKKKNRSRTSRRRRS